MVSKSIAAGTVGVAGAGGVGTWYFLSDTKEVISISKKIEEQGERFILSTFGNTHDTQWDSLIQSYSSLVSNNPDKKPLIDEFSNKAPTKDELKVWCGKNSKTDHELKGKFDSFREWCTKDNLAQHIKITTSLNKVPLALGDEKWNENKNNYNSSATDQNQITNSEGVAIAKDALKDIQTLQTWCFKSAKNLYISDTDKSFVAYKEWCTKSTN